MPKINDTSTFTLGLPTSGKGITNSDIPNAPTGTDRQDRGPDSTKVTLPSGTQPTPLVTCSRGTPDHNGDEGTVTSEYIAFGDTGSLGWRSGTTELEYNVYRPYGQQMDGNTTPITFGAFRETLTPAVARKLQSMLNEVTRSRIVIYQADLAEGISNVHLCEKLQAFDTTLPASYRSLVDNFDRLSSNRYMLATITESPGGSV